MSQIGRRKGQQIGARTRAEAAVHEARGLLTQAQVAEELNCAKESLRQFKVGDGADQFKAWVALARRRISAGVGHHQIVNELCETLAPQMELRAPTPAEGWAAMRRTACILSGYCKDWNNTHSGDEDPLEEDPDRLLVLAAAHVGEGNLSPGCAMQDAIIKTMLDSVISIAAHDRASLAAMVAPADTSSRGVFIPFMKEQTDGPIQ